MTVAKLCTAYVRFGYVERAGGRTTRLAATPRGRIGSPSGCWTAALITTHPRPTFFTFLLNMFWIRDNDQGIYRLPFADARHAPIDATDQAHVIAAILQNPDPHDRQTYPLLGAEELNWHEIAAKVQHTLGIPVRYEPIDIPTFAAGLTAAGASAHFVQHISNVAQDYRDGVLALTTSSR
ncbi:MAG: hypothetical protein WAN71_07560 [Mycobacterium sp.]|uniref:hypothetical protein n=1 Tax=Mycobacterium sp. TaxID=1785 RepID=UPI003BB0CBD7